MMYRGPWGTPGCVGNGGGHIKYPRSLLGPESPILAETSSSGLFGAGRVFAQSRARFQALAFELSRARWLDLNRERRVFNSTY